MANEIYDSTWWGNTIDTASSIGTSTEMIQGQFNLTKLGDELVTNGDFATDSGWSKVGNVTIQNGVASFVDIGTNANSYVQQNVLTTNQTYIVTFEVTRYVSGKIQVLSGSNSLDIVSVGVGTYKLQVKSGSGTMLRIKRWGSYPNYDFDIDNVSVKQVRATTVEASKCLADTIHRIGIQDIQN